jgi:tetratricopeptide (TPR) repeat protein
MSSALMRAAPCLACLLPVMVCCAAQDRTAEYGQGKAVLTAEATRELETVEKRLKEMEPYLASWPPHVQTEEEANNFIAEIDAMDKKLSGLLLRFPGNRRIKHALAKASYFGYNLDAPGGSKVERIYQDLLESDPNDMEALYWLGLFYTSTTIPPYPAIELFNKLFSLDRDGKYIRARWTCALACYVAGQLGEAEKHLRILLEAFPDAEKAKELLETVTKGKGGPK